MGPSYIDHGVIANNGNLNNVNDAHKRYVTHQKSRKITVSPKNNGSLCNTSYFGNTASKQTLGKTVYTYTTPSTHSQYWYKWSDNKIPAAIRGKICYKPGGPRWDGPGLPQNYQHTCWTSNHTQARRCCNRAAKRSSYWHRCYALASNNSKTYTFHINRDASGGKVNNNIDINKECNSRGHNCIYWKTWHNEYAPGFNATWQDCINGTGGAVLEPWQ